MFKFFLQGWSSLSVVKKVMGETAAHLVETPTAMPNGGMQNIAVEAVALFPYPTVSNNLLAGIVYRRAARRRLRMFVGEDGGKAFEELAGVAKMKVRLWKKGEVL